jgi:hypothetical protein
MRNLYILIFVVDVLLNHNIGLAYSNLSPYSYCSGDPINCVDPSGKDIVVLNNKLSSQHLAMLIQDKDGKWQYYSVNGDNVINPITKTHSGGRPFNDVAVGAWDTPQQFLDSKYNVNNGTSGKTDKSINNYDFREGYQIKTTPRQDAIMRSEFSKIAKTEYNLINNNCATAVQKVMVKAGLNVSKPTFILIKTPMPTMFGLIDVVTGYKIKYTLKIVPSLAFKSIMKWNPSGTYLQKQNKQK